jgi:hypothetical protein
MKEVYKDIIKVGIGASVIFFIFIAVVIIVQPQHMYSLTFTVIKPEQFLTYENGQVCILTGTNEHLHFQESIELTFEKDTSIFKFNNETIKTEVYKNNYTYTSTIKFVSGQHFLIHLFDANNTNFLQSNWLILPQRSKPLSILVPQEEPYKINLTIQNGTLNATFEED